MMWQVLRSGVQKLVAQVFGSQLRHNMSSGVIRAVVNAAVLFASYPLYLYFLGYEKYGVWLVLATVLSLAYMGDFGITPAVIKLVSEEYGRGNNKGIQSYVSMSLLVLSISGGVVLLVILCYKAQIISAFRLTGDNALVASWLLPYIGLLSVYVFLAKVLNATLMGLNRMDLANYIQLLGRIVAITVAVGLLYTGRGIESLLIGNALSYAVIHIVSTFFIRRIVRLHYFRISNWDGKRFVRLFRFGGGALGGFLIMLLIEPFNKLMLSRYAGVSTIPVFEIAYKGAFQFRSLIESGLKAIMPEMSRLSGTGTAQAWERIKKINRRVFKLVFLGGLPVYLTFFVGAEFILSIWLKDRYVAAIPPAFRIMLMGSFVSLLGVPAYYTLMGLGKVGHTFASFCVLAVTSVLILVMKVLVSSTLEVSTTALAFAAGATLSTAYLFWQKRLVVKRMQL